ncbi:MAG TPA: DoxX family protein [Gammaproteobacteria bacterium]|nr:DoxX family protein [Gammaproteobacteria bacterium]
MNLRIVSYLLALVFAVSGGAKLASLPSEVEAFARWGYTPSFMYLIGILEVAGAAGLVIPWLSALASICLAALMLGAIGTHAVHREWPMLATAFAICCLATWRGWLGHADIVRLLGGRRS